MFSTVKYYIVHVYQYIYIYVCIITQTLASTLDFWTLPTQICQKVSPHQKTTHKIPCQMSNCLLGGIPVALKAFKISSPEDKSLGMPSL